jgi:hypothetical protein
MCTVILTAKDVTAPEITTDCSTLDQEVDLDSDCALMIPDLRSITAMDNCDNDITITQVPSVAAMVSSAHDSTTTVTLTATDNAGNTDMCTVILTAKDVTAPSISCPADITISTTELTEVVTWTEPIGMDNCTDFNTVRTKGEAPGSAFAAESEREIEYTITDAGGNTERCSFMVRVMSVRTSIETYVYLEGSLFNSQTGTYASQMRTTLNDSRLLPGQFREDPVQGDIYTPILGAINQAYNIGPWNYSGSEGSAYDSQGMSANAGANYPADAVDWVLVSLRSNPTDGSEALCQRAGLLFADGRIEFEPGTDCIGLDSSQSYYLEYV